MNRRFTCEEDVVLVAMIRQGHDAAVIAAKLGRTVISVQARLRQLGVVAKALRRVRREMIG